MKILEIEICKISPQNILVIALSDGLVEPAEVDGRRNPILQRRKGKISIEDKFSSILDCGAFPIGMGMFEKYNVL